MNKKNNESSIDSSREDSELFIDTNCWQLAKHD